MSARVRHPLYSRVLARWAERNERRGQAELRDELVAGLAGRVIEVGAGSGINLRHYGPGVDEVVAVEPEPYLRARLGRERCRARVEVVAATAERLPFADASFDAGVVSLVLCSVPSPAAALAELRRVVRAGGELRFLEHVLGLKRRMSRLQRLADAAGWPRLNGGCHVSRATVEEIVRAGFAIERSRRVCYQPSWTDILMTPHAIGVARRP